MLVNTNVREVAFAVTRSFEAALKNPVSSEELASKWKADAAQSRKHEKAEAAAKAAKKAKKEADKAAKKAEKAALKSLKEATKAAKAIDAAEAASTTKPADPVAPVAETEPLKAVQIELPEEFNIMDIPETIRAAMGALSLDSALDADQASLEFFKVLHRARTAGDIEQDLFDVLAKKFFSEVGEVKAAQANKDWDALAETLALPVAQVVISANMLDSAVSVEDAVASIRTFAEQELQSGRFDAEEMEQRMAVVSIMMPLAKAAVAARDYSALADVLAGRVQPEAEPELPPNVSVDVTDNTVTYTVDLGTTPVEPAPETAMAAAMQRANAPKGNARKGNAPKGK